MGCIDGKRVAVEGVTALTKNASPFLVVGKKAENIPWGESGTGIRRGYFSNTSEGPKRGESPLVGSLSA